VTQDHRRTEIERDDYEAQLHHLRKTLKHVADGTLKDWPAKPLDEWQRQALYGGCGFPVLQNDGSIQLRMQTLESAEYRRLAKTKEREKG
jgi:hypothetical protein